MRNLQIKGSLSLADSEISEVGWGVTRSRALSVQWSNEKKIREGEGHTSMAPDPTFLRFSIL